MAASQETLRRVKEKYPEYRDIPDVELSTVLIAKYPEYDETPDVPRGTLPPPTIGEQAQAAGIGALEAVGRWPGELMSASAEMGKRALLGPVISNIPGLSQAITASTERALQPFQNLTPKAFNTFGDLIGQDIEYYDPNSPQMRSPGAAAVGEFIPNLASLLIRGPTGVRPAQTIAEVGKEVGEMAATGVRGIPRVIEEVVEGALGTTSSTAAPERLFRAAIKPSKAVGQKVEVASKNTISDVFHANPEADKIAATPFEGYQQALNQVKGEVGRELDTSLKQSGFNGNAGDEIAKQHFSKADAMESEGGRAEDIAALRKRGNDFVGKVTDMQSLRGATTSANWELSPLFTKAKEMVNPQLAKVDNISNTIISKVGGEFENKALESLKGADGAVLRKKWSDLTLIEKQASDRLNKLINDAPPAARSIIIDSLSSQAGVGAAIGLAFGKLGSLIPFVARVAKNYARTMEKQLKDSNALITRAYDNLRANPPPRPSRTPPLLPEAMPPVIPQPTTVGGVAVPPPSLERLIERRIREYGNQFNTTTNPGLARRIALEELTQEGLIPPQ